MNLLRDESGVTQPEWFPASEAARLFTLVFVASRFFSVHSTSTMVETAPVYAVEGPIGGGTVLVKSCCALGCTASCRSRSRGVAQVTICGDVGRVYVYGFRTGRDLAASEIRHDVVKVLRSKRMVSKGD